MEYLYPYPDGVGVWSGDWDGVKWLVCMGLGVVFSVRLCVSVCYCVLLVVPNEMGV